MKCIKLVYLLVFFFSSIDATEYSPWFTPLFDLKAELSYLSTSITHFKSEKKEFEMPSRHHTAKAALSVTPWLYWNVEAECFFTQAPHLSFSYESTRFTVRYNVIDDLDCSPFTLVMGVTTAFPGSHFLRRLDFIYRAPWETELHFSLGKEWFGEKGCQLRFWAFGGYGFASSGRGWIHGIGSLEGEYDCLKLTFFTESLVGLGHRALFPLLFQGYSPIAYRRVNGGIKIYYEMPYWGDLEILAWKNLWADNAMFHDWGIKIALYRSLIFL